MLYCYCVTLLLFVSSYVLIVCTVPLPPGVNPIAVDKYIYIYIIWRANLWGGTDNSDKILDCKCCEQTVVCESMRLLQLFLRNIIRNGRICTFVSSYQLNAHFLCSSTIRMLHYDPQHVSSSTLLTLRRTNCIITASGIVTLHKQPYSMPDTVRLLMKSDDTRGCNNTICPPEDEQGTARNMSRIIM